MVLSFHDIDHFVVEHYYLAQDFVEKAIIKTNSHSANLKANFVERY